VTFGLERNGQVEAPDEIRLSMFDFIVFLRRGRKTFEKFGSSLIYFTTFFNHNHLLKGVAWV
jgi:hypothetical protein